MTATCWPPPSGAGADVIVTYNLHDFPDAALAPYGIDAQHPDEFVAHQQDDVRPLGGLRETTEGTQERRQDGERFRGQTPSESIKFQVSEPLWLWLSPSA